MDLISQQRLPTPIGPISTGNPKADAALEQLAVFPHAPSHPSTRPGGKDYDRLVRVANTAGRKALLEVLGMKGLLEPGGSVWDEARYNRLSPAKKKAFRKASDAAASGRKIRVAFIAYLVEAVIPEGYPQLRAIVANRRLDPEIREETLAYLRANFDRDKRKLKELAKAVDIVGWDGKRNEESSLVEEAILCWHEADPKGAYDALAKLVTPAIAKRRSLLVDAIISSIHHSETKVDPRWPRVLARMVADDAVDVVACMALASQPLDPGTVPLMLEALGPLAKVSHLYDGLVELVARIGSPEGLPILQRAIELSPDDAEEIIAKVPKPAKAVIAALRDRPTQPAATPPTRPTLVYRKIAAFKAPKLPPLAKQEAQYRKLFAGAGIPEAYDRLVQRSVLLIPKRVDEPTLAVGATKLGGHPDLPAAVAWPRVGKRPLTFLAQLAFADFAKLLPGELPQAGTLAIFVDDYHADAPTYLEHAKAIYTKAGTTLARREVPEDYASAIYQACRVTLVEKLSLPSPSNAHARQALDAATLDTYASEVWVDEACYPKVLGYRNWGYDGEEPATARLLLQLSGDEQSDMEFGDADPLSIFIGVKALAKGNFAKVWPHLGD